MSTLEQAKEHQPQEREKIYQRLGSDWGPKVFGALAAEKAILDPSHELTAGSTPEDGVEHGPVTPTNKASQSAALLVERIKQANSDTEHNETV